MPLPRSAVRFDLSDVMENRRWWFDADPFPHFRATSVFTSEFCERLTAAFQELLDAGLSEAPSHQRFSRNMQYSDAYGWDFPPDVSGPLAIFYSRAWHDLLRSITGVPATLDVNAALHHHPPGSKPGFVHRDLSAAWMSDQPRPDGMNPMDKMRCSYSHGRTSDPGVAVRREVRAVTMIYYLANGSWQPGDGGQTGLYRSGNDPVDQPACAVAPMDNSILVFENTPASWHSFLTNRRPRNSVILWLHRSYEDACSRWGDSVVSRW